jgi:hypothetical protein
VHIRAQAAAVLADQKELFGDSPANGELADDALIVRGVQYLGRIPSEAVQSEVIAALVFDQKYYRHLIDASLLRLEESVAAAKQLSISDSRFLAGLVNAANDNSDRAHVTRALQIIDGLGKTNIVAQWVRRMTEHADCFIRSMAVSMLCRLHVNPLLIEKQLDSKDARVRANAIEALWGTLSWESKRLLEKATHDPHHRVAVNALLGLYLASFPNAIERMRMVARHPSPMFRIAIAWAMGYTRDEKFIPQLEQLSQDPVEDVRKAAVAALQKYGEGALKKDTQ